MTTERSDWADTGHEPMTAKQRRLLNAACGDLAAMRWHGHLFDKDDYRHLLCAVVLAERLVPGIQTGYGPPGMIRMAQSSKKLTKSDATQSIRLAFEIGDRPGDQGLPDKPVRWGLVVTCARWIANEDGR